MMYSSLSYRAQQRLTKLRNTCDASATVPVDERVRWYMGIWADCGMKPEGKPECQCAAHTPASIPCHKGRWAVFHHQFCVGPKYWQPPWWMTMLNWVDGAPWAYSNDMRTALAAAQVTDGVPAHFGDNFVWSEDEKRPVIGKARSAVPTDRVNDKGKLSKPTTILNKLNSYRHFKRMHMAFEEDLIPFREKKNAAVYRGAQTGSGKSGILNEEGRMIKLLSPEAAEVEASSMLIQRGALPEHMEAWQGNPVLDIGYSTIGVQKLDDKESSQSGPISSVVKRPLSVADQMRYKMILMVEGNDVASGLKWALLSSSAVVMPPPTVESWAMESRLVPWVHYIPLRQDCSDLPEQAAWCLENLEKCEEIGRQGQCFAQQFLYEDRERLIMGKVVQLTAALTRQRSCRLVCPLGECCDTGGAIQPSGSCTPLESQAGL